ncbi:MAG: hypothetical protein COB37_07130 [Kordiimonadales bacterium]|nr:MAG: hypothetical protein COB37_07130 [Kordiimonadales bacterium]
MDVLSDILETLSFKGSLYFTTEFSQPFGIAVPTYKNVMRFHLVLGGSCWIRLAGHKEGLQLQAGDMFIIPRGSAHDLADGPSSDVIPLEKILDDGHLQDGNYLVYGGDSKADPWNDRGENPTRLVCGQFAFNENFNHPLIDELPDYILISGEKANAFSWFDNAMKFMSFESQQGEMGNDAIIKRLSEILFIQAVRVWNGGSARENSFVKAVACVNIGRSLQALHSEINRRWTVETLAKEAGLSRSAFSSNFTKMMGTPPLKYLTMWRIQKARHMLLESDLSIDRIAENIGYQSATAFSKAFKNDVGIGPGKFRKNNK